MRFHIPLLIALAALLAASCGTTEQYVLINDVETREYKAPQHNDLRIKAGDDLQILVAHKLPSVVEEFNRKVNTPGKDDQGTINSYIVNNAGNINFPILDTIHVLGLTCAELEREIVHRIEDVGLARGATVSVKIKNFKVTVIGESGTGVYEFDDENVTIFDLVAKANLAQGGVNNNSNNNNGGSGIRRDKILIIRDCDSTMKMDYVNLLTTDIFYSPYYFLQQNDIVYVYPNKSAIRNSNRLFDFWWNRLSVLTTAVSAVTLMLTLLNNRD